MINRLAALEPYGSAENEILPGGLAAQVLDYWRARCPDGPRMMPCRRDIDPVTLGRLLPNIFLLDVVAGETGATLRWRLAGTAIALHESADPTGRWLSDSLAADQAERIRQFAETVIRERRPTCHLGRWRDSRERWQPLSRLLVPLSEDGTVVSTLLGVVDYAPGEIVPLRGAA